MKKYSYLIIIVLISSLVLAGCSLLSNVGQVPTTEQSGITYLTKGLPQTDLVGLWRFNDNANDSSGKGNLGIVNGGAFYVDSPMDKALSFDGDGDYVEVADSASLDITGDLTIEEWVKFDSFTYPHSYIVGKDTTGQRSYGLAVDGGYYGSDYIGRVGFVVFKVAGVPSIHWGNTVLSTGQWYHIAATYDFVADGTSVMTIYVDGSPDSPAKTNAVGPIYSGTANLQIGARHYPSSRCFTDGTIDEVRIWNTALTADQLIRYGFKGLMSPYALPGQKTFKLGRTIPLKWQYTDFDGNVVDSVDATPAVSYQFVGGGSGDGALVVTDDPGSSGLRYDSDTKTWQFNWQTKELSLTGIYNIWIASDLTGQVNGPFPIELL